MKITRSNLLGGSAALLLVSSALAHHVDVALSHVDGPNVLTEIVHYRLPGNVGVPAYALGSEAHDLALADGMTFSVSDGVHPAETVTFHASDFANIAAATRSEVVAVVNAQLTLGTALVNNSTLFLRGLQGGSAASLDLVDGAGSPLAALGIAPAAHVGGDAIRLVLSQPSGQATDLAGHPYLLLASTTDGEMLRAAGHPIPIGWDATTREVLARTQAGQLPGFRGNLDASADADVTFDPALLDVLFPTGTPDDLHFAFVVFSLDGGSIELVSNRFTVHLAD